MTAPSWYLGPVGAMKPIRSPGRNYDRTGSDAATVVALLGGQAVQRSSRITRQWRMPWSWLNRADQATLIGLRSGQFGPGPYAFIDPATANFLTENQASGTTRLSRPDGFTASAGTLSSATTPVYLGTRSLSWAVPASASTLTLPHPSFTTWPTPAGVQWTLAVWVQASAAQSVTVALVWYDAAGTRLSEVTNAGTVGTSGWTRVGMTGTAPVNASVGLEVRATPAAALTLHVGAARLSLETDIAWMPGEVLPRVSFVDMPETVPVYDRRTASMTLAEVTTA